MTQISKRLFSSKKPYAGKISKQAAHWSSYQWIILILMGSASTLSFADRVNMSVVVPVWIVKYHLNPAGAGFVLSIFGWAYAVGLFFAGPIVARWHQKRVIPLGMVLWTAATWLTALIFSVPLFTVTRSLLGLGESTLIPSNTRIASEIFERGDQTKAVSTFYAGSQLGVVVGAPIAAFILSRMGWQAVFLVTGAFSIIWLILWLPIYRPDKEVIPETEGVPADAEQPGGAKWISLLKQRQTWGLMFGQFGGLYMLYVYVTWLPGMLALQHHFSILSAGWFTSLIFLTSVVMVLLSGWLSDFWLRRGGDLTVVRKTFCCGGMLLSTISIVIAAYTQNSEIAIIMLILAISGHAITTPPSGALSIDLVPRHTVAALFGLQTFFGNIGSAIAPLVTGFLYARTGSFQVALLTTGVITLVFGVGGFGLLLGKVEKPVSLNSAVVEEAIR
ncbi:MAG: MFS transporter [Chloroflexi bacterium]|nr:MFS transporter [Chloroflexota bacterium]